MIRFPHDLDRETIRIIRDEIKQFSASVMVEGKNETVEDKIVNSFANGTVQGYNDAVKQIVEFIEDLLQ